MEEERLKPKNHIQDLVSNQNLNMRGIFQKTPRKISEGNFDMRYERKLEWKASTGFSTEAYLTKFLFVYLGGLIAARKQFIPNFAYFMNTHYNWLRATKFLFGGYLVGCLVSSFNFGHPFLLEDWVRGYFRGLTYKPSIERQNFHRYY
jgi:hypothetical protein